MKLHPKEISTLRLSNQRIEGSDYKNVKKIVEWMGALQAQDFDMAKWAIGSRLINGTDHLVEKAIAKGDILRTHILRPTWHFVSADDIYWMLDLTAPHIKSILKPRLKESELSEKLLSKTNRLLEKSLQGNIHLTRNELAAILNKAGIPTHANRLSYLLFNAELEGILCSGAAKENKHSYALLEERVPKKKILSEEDGLSKLAEKYFFSHGPATLEDFKWWSGLTLTRARQALEMVRSTLLSETIEGKTYWFSDSHVLPGKRIHLLPAFDEFIISYKDRKASLSSLHTRKALSANGIFWPCILINGQVAGLWKRTVYNETVTLQMELFQKQSAATLKGIREAAAAYGRFSGKKLILKSS